VVVESRSLAVQFGRVEEQAATRTPLVKEIWIGPPASRSIALTHPLVQAAVGTRAPENRTEQTLGREQTLGSLLQYGNFPVSCKKNEFM
jgi:hypothetical protein